MRSKIAIYSLGLFVASAFSSASFASESHKKVLQTLNESLPEKEYVGKDLNGDACGISLVEINYPSGEFDYRVEYTTFSDVQHSIWLFSEMPDIPSVTAKKHVVKGFESNANYRVVQTYPSLFDVFENTEKVIVNASLFGLPQSVTMSIEGQSEGEIIHTEEYHCGQLTKKP